MFSKVVRYENLSLFFDQMGACLSCLRMGDDINAVNGDFRSEEMLPVIEGKKSGARLGETPQDATPLLNMVTLSDSSSGSFDQEMIDKLLLEVEDSGDSA